MDAPKSGYLFINDAWDPDWTAEVDGHPAPVLRADFMLRAIQVPTGSSKVVLTYRGHYRVAGLQLPCLAVNLFSDGIMLASFLVAGVALWRRKPEQARS